MTLEEFVLQCAQDCVDGQEPQRIAWTCQKGRHDECRGIYLSDYEVKYPCECACHIDTAAYGRGSARLVLIP